MASPSRSSISKTLVTFLFIFGFLAPPNGRAQGKYTDEEYKAYDEVSKEADPAKKTALVVQFFKTFPQSTLRENAINAYQQTMAQLQSAGKWAELGTLGEQVAAVAPNDEYINQMLASAYQQTKNDKRFVVYAEKVFEKKPTPALAYYLAKAYLNTNSDQKFIQWGEKTVSLTPDNHEILFNLTTKYAALNNYAQASKTAKQSIKVLQGITKAPQGSTEADWQKYSSTIYGVSYSIVGNVAYQAQDYATAVTNLESALKYNAKDDLAYYNLAMSYWRQNKIDVAMLNFAKAHVLRGRMSANAKTYLDTLYKPGHGGSLAGEDRILAKAQADLGIK